VEADESFIAGAGSGWRSHHHRPAQAAVLDIGRSAIWWFAVKLELNGRPIELNPCQNSARCLETLETLGAHLARCRISVLSRSLLSAGALTGMLTRYYIVVAVLGSTVLSLQPTLAQPVSVCGPSGLPIRRCRSSAELTLRGFPADVCSSAHNVDSRQAQCCRDDDSTRRLRSTIFSLPVFHCHCDASYWDPGARLDRTCGEFAKFFQELPGLGLRRHDWRVRAGHADFEATLHADRLSANG